MAFFNVNPTSTVGVEILATGTGHVRFMSIGVTNMTSTPRTVTIFDGTAAAGTPRVYISVPAMETTYLFPSQIIQQGIFPRGWWTTGNSIECNCDGNSSVRVWGEVIREARSA